MQYDQATEKKRNICGFNNLCVFFLIHIFEVTYSKLAFVLRCRDMYVYIYLYKYIYLYIFIFIYIYIYIYIYI